MFVSKILRDITTGRDNATHEIVRTFTVIVLGVFVMCCFVGTAIEVRHAFKTDQFDLQSYFQAFATFITAIGGFILMAAGAIRMKPENSKAALEQDIPPAAT